MGKNHLKLTLAKYNTFILKLLKANMNIQFDTGVYAMLIYSAHIYVNRNM